MLLHKKQNCYKEEVEKNLQLRVKWKKQWLLQKFQNAKLKEKMWR
jgi:hypothetical protein